MLFYYILSHFDALLISSLIAVCYDITVFLVKSSDFPVFFKSLRKQRFRIKPHKPFKL